MKKRVLIFNDYFFPAKNYGGPATSVQNMIEACADKIDFYLIVANHDFGEKEKLPNIHNGWNEYGNARIMYVADDEFTINNIKKWIKMIKPTSLYLGGVLNLNNFKYIFSLKDNDSIRIIVPPRGEVNKNAVKRKKYKKIPYFFLVKMIRLYKKCYFHATSEAERDGIIKYLGVDKKNIKVLPNISKSIKFGRKVEKKEGILNAVYIARLCSTKNLLEALKALKSVRGIVNYKVYGPLEDENYWKLCQEEIKKLPNNIHVEYLGNLEPKFVDMQYFISDCTILPTITENYGHSIVEAIIAGCPCIIPQGTTPWDSINNCAGYTYHLGNIEELRNKIQMLIDMNNLDYQELIETTYDFARHNIISETLKEEYIKLLIG